MVSNTGERGAPKVRGGTSMALRLTSKRGRRGKGEQMKEGTKEELCQKLTLVST